MCIASLYLLATVANTGITFLVIFATCVELKRHTGRMFIVGICDFHYIPHVARICDLNI